ncbi:DedA family protein [Effusibacillus pohliae]|uniref:DedA family protein n=1 Tax=Effusibacillus pohliae TaxID=232270 RepID=UPI00037D1EE4|nr:DedA family protein [Effusibacillus pohliae]
MEQQFAQLISEYGYPGIFIFLAVGIVGLPLPDEMLMTFVGYTVYQGKMSYPLAVVSAFSGSAVGITISYLLGSKLGLPFLKKFGPKLHITERKIQRTHDLFEKYGSILIFVGYFIPGVRHVTGYISGIANIGIRKFGLFAYSGALAWSLTFISLGRELGENWYLVQEYLHRYGLFGFALVIILATVMFIYFKFRRGNT